MKGFPYNLRVSKVIGDYFDIALLPFLIGSRNSLHIQQLIWSTKLVVSLTLDTSILNYPLTSSPLEWWFQLLWFQFSAAFQKAFCVSGFMLATSFI